MVATRTSEIVAALCGMLQRYNKNNLELGGATKIAAELNIDSVEVMDLVMELEEKFDVDIPINLLSDVETVEDLAKVVAERMEER